MMNTFVIYSLRATAAATSATSAAVAYPAASNMFGEFSGGVVVGGCAVAIYAGWHFIGSEPKTHNGKVTLNSVISRGIAGAVSIIFASAMVAGIHTTATQPAQQNAAKQTADNQALYRDQEASRIRTLSELTTELRVTSKKKNPEEYERLQKQIDTLSTPTKKPTAQASSNTASAYSWIASAAYEVVTPALLILAGLFARREQPEQHSNNRPVDAVVDAVDANTQVIENIELTQLPQQLTPVSDDDIQDAISARLITLNADGYVTAAAIVDATGCTARQSRTAVKKAVDHGYLLKTGQGGATRYSYPTNTNIRRVK